MKDLHMRYDCDNCKKSFIVGENMALNLQLYCPYCKNENVEKVFPVSNYLGLKEFNLYFRAGEKNEKIL